VHLNTEGDYRQLRATVELLWHCRSPSNSLNALAATRARRRPQHARRPGRRHLRGIRIVRHHRLPVARVLPPTGSSPSANQDPRRT